MVDEPYNNWPNYETWAVALWMDNEQYSYDYWRERARECLDLDADNASVLTKAEQAQFNLADEMKEAYEEETHALLEMAGSQCTVWADLLSAALSEVRWHSIAENLIEEVKDGEEDPHG